MSTQELGPGAHVCWAYDERSQLLPAMREFIAEGVEFGHRVAYVAVGSDDDLRGDLATIDDLDDLVDAGALVLTSLTDIYGLDEVIDPRRQVKTYAGATERAVDDGYAGLRVAAEATPLVRTAEQRDAFCRYEYLIDRYMATNPFSALCAYRTADLGDDAVAELACLHPTSTEGATMFQLSSVEGGVLQLTGEVDALCAEQFEQALRRVQAGLEALDGEVVVDVRAVDFLDHRAILALSRHAVEVGADRLALRDAPPIVCRLVAVLDLPNVVLSST